MFRIIKILFIALALAASATVQAAKPAAQTVMQRSAAKIKAMPSLTAKLAMSQGNNTTDGTLTLSGDRFIISSAGQAPSIWYDGKSQWVYNPPTNELNLSTPTPDELATVNPFVIVNSLNKAYKSRQLKSPAGVYLIELTPIDRRSDICRVELTIDETTYLPKRIAITMRSGDKAVIGVSNIKQGTKMNETQFRPPKAITSKAELIDLR